MLFSKTVQEIDYQTYGSIQHIKNMRQIMRGVPYPFGHQHREWEYGITLEALRQNDARTVLEVGGGGSLFAVAASWIDMQVLQLDPGSMDHFVVPQSRWLKRPLPTVVIDFFEYPLEESTLFDAVTCISVIEHVGTTDDALRFFNELCRHVKPGGLLSITTDFHPSGKGMFGGHHRTYNTEMINDLIKEGKQLGMKVFGAKPDYSHFEPNVYDLYTFASLSMRKAE